VTLALAKLHLRVSTTLEDALVAQYLASARRSAEMYVERSMAVQEWEALVGGVGSSTEPILLPMGPVRSVSLVESVPPDGRRDPVVGWGLVGDYLNPPNEGWPAAPAALAVTYEAGTDTPEPPWVQAILLLLGEYYDHRAAVITGTIVAEMPHAVGFLLDPYRASSGLVPL
jgi:uncharacterized phiE125 gp8 family phage protein